MTDFEPIIGLEVHIQLGTTSKAFSAAAVDSGAAPNSLTDPTVLALPGALPTFNRRAVELTLRLGLATGCSIRSRSRFARKHYFYPDLPKGYQITQYDEPLCEAGSLEILVDDQPHKINITRIHLEEDAGKNLHRGDCSLVDLNRCGVPLCEVVSAPELTSARAAAAYMRALRQLVRYLDISDADMDKGQLRCDANVSLRAHSSERLGTRTELKNINSFKFVERAIDHEIARQRAILAAGGEIALETRLWDATRGLSRSMRSKEESSDYRYLPDPDLPPLVIDGRLLQETHRDLPELPMARFRRLVAENGLSRAEARTLTAERDLADYYDLAVTSSRDGDPRAIASWVLTELLGALKRDQRAVTASPIAAHQLAALVRLIDDQTISGKIAKTVFARMYATGDPPRDIVDREGLRQITSTKVITDLATAVIADHPTQVSAYRAGKSKLMGFFVGQVMKASQGKANPEIVNQILAELLTR